MEEKEITIKEEDKQKSTKMQIFIQISFLILLIAAIAGLIATIITVHKYSDMLANPLGYNLAKFDISSCYCYDNSNKIIIVDAIGSNNNHTDFINSFSRNSVTQLNLSGLNLSN